MSKTAQILLLSLVLFLIWLPPELFVLKVVSPFLPDDLQQALAMDEKAQSFGEACETTGLCGDVLRIQCAADGEPSLVYFNTATDSVISQCQKCCEENMCLDSQCPENCPPAKWTCDAKEPPSVPQNDAIPDDAPIE